MTCLTNAYLALVVEEDAQSGRFVQTVLHQCGLKSVIVAIGEDDALKMLTHSKVDVVVCDCTGKWPDGFNILQRIRDSEGPFDSTLPIIMMARDASVAKVTRARDAGATEFIAKPMSVSALTKALISALEKPRDFVEGEKYVGPDRRRRTVDVKDPRRRADKGSQAG